MLTAIDYNDYFLVLQINAKSQNVLFYENHTSVDSYMRHLTLVFALRGRRTG